MNKYNNKIGNNINFELVGGIEKSAKKASENLASDFVGKDNNKANEYANFETIDKKNNVSSNERINIDVKDALKRYNNDTSKQANTILNFIVSFLLETIFAFIAFNIPVLGFILSIVYFIKDEKISALIYIIFAIVGYIANVNLLLNIINSIF